MVKQAKIKANHYVVELYRIFLMEGKPLEDIAKKMIDYATDKRLLFPFERDRQLAFFIFKYYNGDIKKLLEYT